MSHPACSKGLVYIYIYIYIFEPFILSIICNLRISAAEFKNTSSKALRKILFSSSNYFLYSTDIWTERKKKQNIELLNIQTTARCKFLQESYNKERKNTLESLKKFAHTDNLFTYPRHINIINVGLSVRIEIIRPVTIC